MSLEVVPLGNIVEIGEITKIAVSINHHVKKVETKELLYARHLLGVLNSHSGKLQNSELAISCARRQHVDKNLGVYALRSVDRYVGMATVDPYPKLKRQKVALPPKFAIGPLGSHVEPTGPEISAWVSPGHGPNGLNNLIEAYGQLRQTHGVAAKIFDEFSVVNDIPVSELRAWTLEPIDAPQWIHTAIRQSGFLTDRTNTACYDNGESRKAVPPISRLYVASA